MHSPKKELFGHQISQARIEELCFCLPLPDLPQPICQQTPSFYPRGILHPPTDLHLYCCPSAESSSCLTWAPNSPNLFFHSWENICTPPGASFFSQIFFLLCSGVSPSIRPPRSMSSTMIATSHKKGKRIEISHKNCLFWLHVKMIVFCIYWIKQNILLKLISPFSFYFCNVAIGKIKMIFVPCIWFLWNRPLLHC